MFNFIFILMGIRVMIIFMFIFLGDNMGVKYIFWFFNVCFFLYKINKKWMLYNMVCMYLCNIF